MRTLVEAHRRVVGTLVAAVDPHHNWARENWGVRHGRAKLPGIPVYHAIVHMPPDFCKLKAGLYHNPLRDDKQTQELVKAMSDCPDGRWVTVHPNGDDSKGHPVHICPNNDGSWTVVRGVGGALNGLRMTGVKSEEEYKHLARQQRTERILAKRDREIQEVRRIGAQAFLAKQAEKQSAEKSVDDARVGAERNFIGTVLASQGIDKSHLDLPQAKLDSVASDKTAATLAKRHHQKLLTYAKAVASTVKEIVASGIEQIAADTIGDVAVSDLVRSALGGQTTGYASPVKALAAEYGYEKPKADALVAGFRFRDLVDRAGSVPEAEDRRSRIAGSIAARSAAEGKVKDAAAALASEGVGPDVIQQFSRAPRVETLADAVGILKAAREAEQAASAAASLKEQIESADVLGNLPKAAVVVAKPLSDADAADYITKQLTDDAMQRSMSRLVTSSNDLERETGSMREHFSVGANAAFNAILGTVDHTTIDPILHDILGTAGAARVIAARWRRDMAPEQFEGLKRELAEHHVRTQEELADAATQEAGEYMDRAEALQKDALDPDTPEALTAAVQAHSERVDLIRRARQSLGVARGRLEAAAALNEAMMHGSDKPLQVSLGNTPIPRALEQAYALGLTTPAEYDRNTGQLLRDGDFEVSRDAENTVLTIHPSGLGRLAEPADPDLVARADRSARIKNGREDEIGWIPAGITDRPATAYTLDPIQRTRAQRMLNVHDQDTPEQTAGNLRQWIGQMMADGRDPDDIASQLRSEEFVGSLGLSPRAELQYLAVADSVAPAFSAAPGTSERDKVDQFKKFQADRVARFQECLDASVKDDDVDRASLDRQRIGSDALTRDALYVSALADPRCRFAFHKLGDLTDSGRAAIRAYAYEKLFGLDPKADDEPITPLADDQRAAYTAWQQLNDREGDPYSSIQAAWRKQDEDGAGLFGEPEIHPLAGCDLTDDTAVVAAARRVPKMLSFQPLRTADGQDIYPELEAGSRWYADGETWRQSDDSDRTEQSIATACRQRIRGQLREHWIRNVLGMPSLADTGWSPTSVKTSSDRWAEYAASMGDREAYQTVQDFMAGDLAHRFAAEYAARGGGNLTLGVRPVAASGRHMMAMLPPEARASVDAMDASERAKLLRRAGGRWIATGSIRDQAELQRVLQEEGAKLFSVGKDHYAVNVHRPTIGSAAERALAGMLPYIDTSRKIDAARNVVMHGDAAPRQRAIKLVQANKRQGVNLQVGGGKTIVGLGAFTDLREQGKAHRALITVPSNIVGQFSDEIYRFRDPSKKLAWCHSDALTADGRRKALSDPNTHIVITTAEALREDVTHAIATHFGVSPEQARDKIMDEPSEAERHKLIDEAMKSAGMNFDYTMFDEGHRLLTRAGKPDAHMQRIADGVGARSPYYVYSTADAIKNDPSEAWDVLHKIDPFRYPEGSRAQFLRKYGRSTVASGLALQREVDPYLYAAKMDFGIDTDHGVTKLDLTPEQQTAYAKVTDAYNRARQAKLRGRVDMDALRELSPGTFKDGTDEDETAAKLNKALATVRDGALARVVDAFPGGAKENAVADYVSQHRGEPTVVFAHHRDAVASIAKRLRGDGHRVVTLTGNMSGTAKNGARLAFSPPAGEPQADVIVSSDAGAMGSNLQRGVHLINVDIPVTPMLHAQRIGRIRRPGQKAKTVRVRDLVTNTEHDNHSRARLESKGELRELLTSPSHLIDDDGLAESIERSQTDRIRYKKAA